MGMTEKQIIDKWHIPKENMKGRFYKIYFYDDGSTKCTCRAWNATHSECKHIQYVRKLRKRTQYISKGSSFTPERVSLNKFETTEYIPLREIPGISIDKMHPLVFKTPERVGYKNNELEVSLVIGKYEKSKPSTVKEGPLYSMNLPFMDTRHYKDFCWLARIHIQGSHSVENLSYAKKSDLQDVHLFINYNPYYKEKGHEVKFIWNRNASPKIMKEFKEICQDIKQWAEGGYQIGAEPYHILRQVGRGIQKARKIVPKQLLASEIPQELILNLITPDQVWNERNVKRAIKESAGKSYEESLKKYMNKIVYQVNILDRMNLYFTLEEISPFIGNVNTLKFLNAQFSDWEWMDPINIDHDEFTYYDDPLQYILDHILKDGLKSSDNAFFSESVKFINNLGENVKKVTRIIPQYSLKHGFVNFCYKLYQYDKTHESIRNFLRKYKNTIYSSLRGVWDAYGNPFKEVCGYYWDFYNEIKGIGSKGSKFGSFDKWLKEEVESWKVKSMSDPNKEYTVTKFNDGTWKCTCPHHTYRHSECKHIRKIKNQS